MNSSAQGTWQHLGLRDFVESDSAAVFDVYGDPDVAGPLGLPTLSRAQVAGLVASTIESARSSTRRGYHFAVVAGDRVIGTATLGRDPHQPEAACLGFALRKDVWGHGHGTRTARALLEFGFEALGLHRVWGACLTTNEASAATLLRAGMTREGLIRGHLKVGEVWCDTATYGILRQEWSGYRRSG
ncbi:MAG TPA: GNAT family protein [Pseudonocardiaceae bacterium]|jgi:RimJ/RimL family protein N-acetyltransferase